MAQLSPRANAATPFPFLSLPPELRNMVYYAIVSSTTIATQRHMISPSEVGITQTSDIFWPTTLPEIRSEIWLVRKSLPVALIFTCRAIYTKVAPLFAPLMTELATETLRSAASGYAADFVLACAPSSLVARLGGA
ncbi:hypothetical protein IQ06DRAFT_303429 [Phaeosphaeriaceae sp. SRC1lsM3a]|nr:hypothetical protein IQ06DRAFT_303429 [Stagonospora sp. SRC1lsM3a]